MEGTTSKTLIQTLHMNSTIGNPSENIEHHPYLLSYHKDATTIPCTCQRYYSQSICQKQFYSLTNSEPVLADELDQVMVGVPGLCRLQHCLTQEHNDK
jgi:hypothetical protein